MNLRKRIGLSRNNSKNNVISILSGYDHLTNDHFHEFNKIARQLINHCVIVKNEIKYKIREIEFYYRSGIHPDPFVHEKPILKTVGRWYFHPSGVDITFGNGQNEGSILIRGLIRMDDELVINGSYKVFEELFQDNGSVDGNELNKVYIEQKDGESEQSIMFGPRSGLRIIASEIDHEDKQEYMFKPYRFIAEDYYLISERYLFGLYQVKLLNKDFRQVNENFNLDQSIFRSCCQKFDKGKKMQFIEVIKLKQTLEKNCLLLGHLSKRYTL